MTSGGANNKAGQGLLFSSLLVFALGMGSYLFFHFTPGALSPDSLSILTQARSGVFEDGHPPLMAMIWRQVDYMVPGSVGMLALNLTLFYGGLCLIFFWAAQKYGYFVIPFFITVGLFPPIIGILGVIWIDITMAGLFLSAIGVFLHCASQSKDVKQVAVFVVVISLAALGLATRHNGAAAAFPLITLFLVKFRRASLNSISCFLFASGIGFLLSFILFLGAKQLSTWVVDTPKHFWRVGAMYDIAGISYHERRNLFYPDLFSDNSLADIDKLYSPRSLTPLLIGEQVHALPGQLIEKAKPFDVRELNSDLNRHLFANWFYAILHHPISYLKHRLDVFDSLVTRSPWGLWAPVFEVIYPNKLGIAERRVPYSAYFDLVRELAQTSSIFVPLSYLLVCAIGFIPSLFFGLRLQNDALMLVSALYGSGLAHMVGLFFLVGSSDFRYSHWMIVTTVLGTAIAILEFFSFLLGRNRNYV